jgi:hypothetical protein
MRPDLLSVLDVDGALQRYAEAAILVGLAQPSDLRTML